ncbi:hypothetical protein Pla123a_27590 [Posidoniimonas polymericola]|uniref:PEP-CTERM protein-sorting domain-containing protein n=1 Tax=Posidoniimonas polymericola TaxID=2528002 RepID=A0A5C5YLX4_9BACT|nr:hypothetical protein [Posidoniimonas polymericola]TWT75973.1 hypothetical protein Pla123a_27590 [Posidoniimonas polymericola]
MNHTSRLIVALLAALAAGSVAQAGPILAGSADYTFDNTFFTRLYPGTPFNPTASAVDVPVFAQGAFTQVWGEQVGDEIQDELTSILSSGFIAGMPPVPFDLYGGINEAPDLGAFTGSLTSIVNHPVTGELISAFRSVGGPFRQVLANGATLYTVDPYVFVASVDSLPFESGDIFIGTQDVDVRYQLGPTIDPINDPVVGSVLAGGVITITPEPIAAALAVTLVVCSGLSPSRRRRLA